MNQARVRVRVAGIDDDTIMRDGLPLLLREHDVVATFATVTDFLDTTPQVDVVLLDLKLAGTGRFGAPQGQAAVRAVTDAGYRVLVYTNERRRAVLVGCLAAGALGVVHKAEPLSALADAVSRVADDQVVITQALTGLAELAERRGQLPHLSPRQREVLAGRARGESFAGIAARLYITPKTAEEHMRKVTDKFAEYLRDHSPADLERHLGLEPPHLTE
ncbi:MAG TPA: LuxR C-terminal-related transcriptional regulator [Pseudonocardiaceae bacterium]